MIKLAYNKDKNNLVFMIDKIEREGMTSTGIIEKYVGTLVDTDTMTRIENFKESVLGFDAVWTECPTAICNLIDDVRNQTKTATPTTSAQEITPDAGYTGLSKVTIAAAPVDAAQTATLSTSEDVTYEPSTGKVGLASITVPRVTASIDANIVAGNIKNGVTILGVEGTYIGE